MGSRCNKRRPRQRGVIYRAHGTERSVLCALCCIVPLCFPTSRCLRHLTCSPSRCSLFVLVADCCLRPCAGLVQAHASGDALGRPILAVHLRVLPEREGLHQRRDCRTHGPIPRAGGLQPGGGEKRLQGCGRPVHVVPGDDLLPRGLKGWCLLYIFYLALGFPVLRPTLPHISLFFA